MKEYEVKKNRNWQKLGDKFIKQYVADLYQSSNIATSGVLTIGKTYTIFNLLTGDDFSNVGYASLGVPFVATGTTPTVWINGTAIYSDMVITATELINTIDVYFKYEYINPGVYIVTASKPIFNNCGMGCPPGQTTQLEMTNTFSVGIAVGAVTAFAVSNTAMIIMTINTTTALDDNILGHYNQNALKLTFYPPSK